MSTKQENNKVTLYIATHNKTGLKYFGKTITQFTNEDLQKYYHGSGKYWKRHLKKYGDDVTMEIYGIYDLDENSKNYVKPIALKFSEENNIVNGIYNSGLRKGKKVWANLEIEDGLNGGLPSEKNRDAIIKANKNKTCYKDKKGEILKLKINDPRVLSGEYIAICKGIKYQENDKRYDSRRGNRPYNALDILIYDNNKKIIYSCEGNFKQICEEHNLPFKALTKSYKNEGAYIFNTERSYKRTKKEYQQYKGWYAKIEKGIIDSIIED